MLTEMFLELENLQQFYTQSKNDPVIVQRLINHQENLISTMTDVITNYIIENNKLKQMVKNSSQ